MYTWGFPGGSDSEESACDAGDSGSTAGVERSLGGGHGNPLQYLAWEIPWTVEPGGLQSTGSQRVRQEWATDTFTLHPWDCGVINLTGEAFDGYKQWDSFFRWTVPSTGMWAHGWAIETTVSVRSLAWGTPNMYPPVLAVNILAGVYRAEGRGEMALVVPGREQAVFPLTACSLLGMKTIHS